MVIQIVSFDQIISTTDWDESKSGDEITFVAKPNKLGVSLFTYIDGDNNTPILTFRPNSRIRISGGELIFDTDDIIENTNN